MGRVTKKATPKKVTRSAIDVARDAAKKKASKRLVQEDDGGKTIDIAPHLEGEIHQREYDPALDDELSEADMRKPYVPPVPGEAMKFFPKGFTPRDVQIDAINRIDAALSNPDIDYVVLEGPPGVGKSLIGMTMALRFGEAYFCTLTKQLQNQMMKDFAPLGMKELKGRAAFQCASARDTCSIGAILYKGKHACHIAGTCPYYTAKLEAFKAPFTIANYHSFLANIGMADDYRALAGGTAKIDEDPETRLDDNVRPLLVLDEAHAIEAFLLDECGVEIRLSKIPLITKQLPMRSAPLKEYFLWLDALGLQLQEKAKTTPDPKEKDDILKMMRKIYFTLQHKDAEQWIAEPMTEKDDNSEVNNIGFVLKPLTVKAFGHRVWRWGTKVLMMSATILNAKTVCESLGLDLERGEYIALPMPFKKENRPVYVSHLDMSYKARDESWPLMYTAVENILNHHAKEKGLLLCPSNVMLSEIRKNLPRALQDRLILAFGDDREKKYAEHVASKLPTVLCASGYWEGADLKDDASRFQIIPSVPRAHWSGQVKARGSMDPDWYRWLAWTKLIQGIGRSVRHENDTAVTYVLDKDFRTELNRSRGSLIPAWLAEAVQLLDT